ncbi:MAG: NUDIX domain-containing protein [Simkaniaceae bacterium]|nr:NUDIX domain-containing protein [Simkaniaceae bacterium]
MHPIQETAFGIIPLSKQGDSWEVFLIKHVKGKYWGFPKGHTDQVDIHPEETAERELLEETGLKILERFDVDPLYESYQFLRDDILIEKSVYYFLASVTRDFTLETEEVIDGKWLKIPELLDYMTFDEGKMLIQKLIDILEGM